MISVASSVRDLILLVQHQGNALLLAPFFNSLMRTGYRGRVVVFTSQLSDRCLSDLKNWGAEIQPFTFVGRRQRQPLARLWPVWRRYFASRDSAARKHWLAHCVFHLRYRRYLLYADYLQHHGHQFDRVMLSDSRDVFFQRDPFSWQPSTGLHVVLEDEATRIGRCRLHRLWLGCQFGEEYVQRHADHLISCSGTTFGDVASIQDYLAQMKSAIMSARNLARIYGGDQGIHNHLLIERRLKNVTIHSNHNGPVLTLGVVPREKLHFNDQGEILNTVGQVVPILHQYDRLPTLEQHLLARINTLMTPHSNPL